MSILDTWRSLTTQGHIAAIMVHGHARVGDVAVRQNQPLAVEGLQDGVLGRDPLDGGHLVLRALHGDHVAFLERAVQHHRERGDRVLGDFLRRQGERDAADAEAGERGAHVEAGVLERRDAHQHPVNGAQIGEKKRAACTLESVVARPVKKPQNTQQE